MAKIFWRIAVFVGVFLMVLVLGFSADTTIAEDIDTPATKMPLERNDEKVFKPDTSECRQLLDSKKYSKALSVCTKAAEEGDPSAQFNLSVMYEFGRGVSKSEVDSIKWLRSAAEQLYPPAQFALASRYGDGDGVPKDSKESLRLLMDSADRGFLLSQVMLGMFYESGYEKIEIEKNISTATNWYRRAAAHCDACQYELWRVYSFGLGVEKDLVKAFGFIKKAAEGGLPKAQMQLAFRYYSGEGTSKDNIQAYIWFYIAEKGGDSIAQKALRQLSKEISRSEKKEAKVIAQDMMKKLSINTEQLCEIYQQFCTR